jgi:hypothetical protein
LRVFFSFPTELEKKAMEALLTQHAPTASPSKRRMRGAAAPGRLEFGRTRPGGSARDVLSVAGLGRFFGQAAGAVDHGGNKNSRGVLNYTAKIVLH